MVHIVCAIYNIIVIGIFTLFAYQMKSPWLVFIAILFLMSSTDDDNDDYEEE